MNLLKTILLFLCISILSPLSLSESLPELCTQDCTHHFGEVLGESPSGVVAYSNCSNQCVNPEPQFINKTFTGIKWQCVEYARRWLLVNKKVVYGDVDIAEDIWSLDVVHSPDKKEQFEFLSIVNGSKNLVLQRGDLLIYSRAFYGTGHVAVVLNVDEKRKVIKVGEQNFSNLVWDEDFSREIQYIKNKDRIWLLDEYLIGWKRVVIR